MTDNDKGTPLVANLNASSSVSPNDAHIMVTGNTVAAGEAEVD